MKDEIIYEIHKFREAYAKKFNYDLDLIYNDLKLKELKLKEKESGRKYVSLSKKGNAIVKTGKVKKAA